MNTKKVSHDKIMGTGLQGYIDISYAEIVKVLGNRHSDGDGYKVDAEWMIQFEDGTIATIYNYKDGNNYNQGAGKPVADIRFWHIGGKKKKAVELVYELFGKPQPE